MHAYVINLARSFERRAHITAELNNTGLDYDIITAVDGRDVDLLDTTIVDPSLPTTGEIAAGTVGAALSHLSIYRQVIADGLDHALVLEDDVMLPADLASLADAVAHELTGSEVALLSYDSPEPCTMSYEGLVELPSSRALALPVDLCQPRSGGGYIITREACKRMVKSVLPLRVQADSWWFYYREGVLDRVRCVTPLQVLKCPRFTSTIGSYSLRHGVRGQLAGLIVRRQIPLVHQALCYRRKRIYRQWGRYELADVPFIEKPSRLE